MAYIIQQLREVRYRKYKTCTGRTMHSLTGLYTLTLQSKDTMGLKIKL